MEADELIAILALRRSEPSVNGAQNLQTRDVQRYPATS